jgi:hypothetical protein
LTVANAGGRLGHPSGSTWPPTRGLLLLLRLHADNVVAWFNDLMSWPKEAAGGDRAVRPTEERR